MMHNMTCAIMHLFVTYQKNIFHLYPVSVYRGVPRSVHSEFDVSGAIPVRDADAKDSSSAKQNRRDKYISSVEQNGLLFLYGDFSNFDVWTQYLCTLYAFYYRKIA